MRSGSSGGCYEDTNESSDSTKSGNDQLSDYKLLKAFSL
jgi:hypothetical protein